MVKCRKFIGSRTLSNINHCPVIRWVETLVAIHDKDYRRYRFNPENLVNKKTPNIQPRKGNKDHSDWKEEVKKSLASDYMLVRIEIVKILLKKSLLGLIKKSNMVTGIRMAYKVNCISIH